MRNPVIAYVAILSSNSPVYSLQLMYQQYVEDYKSFYGIKVENLTLNYSEIGEQIVLLKDEEGSIVINFFPEEYFLGERTRNNKFLYLCSVDAIVGRLSMSRGDLLNTYTLYSKSTGLIRIVNPL